MQSKNIFVKSDESSFFNSGLENNERPDTMKFKRMIYTFIVSMLLLYLL
jgi:hypothetical protein